MRIMDAITTSTNFNAPILKEVHTVTHGGAALAAEEAPIDWRLVIEWTHQGAVGIQKSDIRSKRKEFPTPSTGPLTRIMRAFIATIVFSRRLLPLIAGCTQTILKHIGLLYESSFGSQDCPPVFI
ncbi:hypothetical protein DFH07DRAFT_764439 [Mycena maculata]|uniref:Uncharacterized protein n=1 Tax=Mycena maculata TaxID=230809 RepID=A0AAD7P033_9AGAR|nr:hypothetical protein DFH07DRAFT_764439 [Mycena maculata]